MKIIYTHSYTPLGKCKVDCEFGPATPENVDIYLAKNWNSNLPLEKSKQLKKQIRLCSSINFIAMVASS